MSIEVMSLVKRRKVGDKTLKAVLGYMADYATVDGEGIWVSKPNMQADLEYGSIRSIQNAVKGLLDAGLIEEVGKRPCKNGFTYEYRIVISAVKQLPSTREIDEDTPAINAGVPQDLEGETQDIGGATTAPVQPLHPTPAIDAGGPPQPLHPNRQFNHQGYYCAANATHRDDFDFGSFFDRIWRAYPNKGSWPETEGAVSKLIDAGESPADIEAAVKAYATTTAGYDRQRVKLSQNFFADGFWRKHVPTGSAAMSKDDLVVSWAAQIQSPTRFGRLSDDAITDCFEAGLVTPDQIKAAQEVWQ